MTAFEISSLVERELTRISDPNTVALIRDLLVSPRCEQRPWGYGEPNQTFSRWIVAEHPSSNTVLAYCEHGFGPRCSWGLLCCSGERLNIGMDSSWFTSLEDCVRDSCAWPEQCDVMKSHQNFWQRMAADWKPTVLLALPMFVAAMWFGIAHKYQDIGLFAAVMALGTLHVAEMAVLAFRKYREWRNGG